MLKWNNGEAVNKNMSYDEPRAVYFFLPFSLFFQSFFSVLQVLAPVIMLLGPYAKKTLIKIGELLHTRVSTSNSFSKWWRGI